jgi:dephospho-CoA kinase
MELDLNNKEWQDALQIVNYTRRSLFLTGKAGTGKSTFLRYVSKNTKKKHVILAPTGIAAINAGGSTLHSFFRLPFHPLLPNDTRYDRRHIRETLKYSSAQRKLLREVELIIIDEISMVRADIIDFTRRSLFLTGKAGTGKSTFLRYVAENTKKKHVILAPTGIAAINAGGSTLHSFFRLPFHPLLPNDRRYDRRHMRETLKYSSDMRKMLRELELIIIDEISMVRADNIDFIDKLMRIYTRTEYEPFGGKQLLLVGDIFQLEPVLNEDDRQLLTPFYPSPFFFHAHVW